MKQILKLTLILLLLIISCEKLTYSPEKKNYVSIQQNVINDVSITFGNQIEPIGLFGTMNLNYNLHLGSKEFYKIEFYLDSVYIGSTENETNYTIYTSGFNNGTYTLRFDIWVFSGTGSLADILESEFAILSKDVQVIIDNTPPEPVTNITFDIYQGQLRLSWPKYNRSNFQEYIIYRNDHEYGQIPYQNQNTYFDSNYIGGGPFEYRIDLKASNTIAYGTTFTYHDSIPQIQQITLNSLNRPTIEWLKCKYYANQVYYKLFKNNSEITKIYNANQTSFTDLPIGFGSAVEYRIGTYSGNNAGLLSRPQETWLGYQFPECYNIFFVNNLNSYFINAYPGIVKLDAQSFNELQNFNCYNYDVAFDGSRLISYDWFADNFKELDPINLNVINEHDISDYLDIDLRISNLFFLHPNKVIIEGYEWRGSGYYSDRTVILDIDTINYLSYVQNNRGTAPRIYARSSNGNYVIINNDGFKLYNVSTGNFNLVYSIPNYTPFCFYDDLDAFILFNNSMLSVKACANGATLNEFPVVENAVYPCIDYDTGYIGMRSNSNNIYYIYNLSTGNLVKEVKLNSTNLFYLINSILFSCRGYYLPLQYN